MRADETSSLDWFRKWTQEGKATWRVRMCPVRLQCQICDKLGLWSHYGKVKWVNEGKRHAALTCPQCYHACKILEPNP